MRSGSVLGALNVFAGTDFVLPTTSTTTAALNGTATDPNNPSTLLPVSWSVLKALGTGTITFSNVNIRNPTVNIPLGIYETILQFTASSLTDSGITAADAIKINRYS